MDRKLFLTWGLTTPSAWAVGCSDDAVPGGPGSGGGAGASVAGTAGATSGGTFSTPGGASSGGTFASAGTGGTGGAGGMSASAPNCNAQLVVFVTANHGHTFQVTAADVMAGMPKTYDTKGTSDHEHWVQLTAADFSKLKAGSLVRKLSCNDGHEHEFIVNCVGNAAPETTSGVAAFCDTEHQCADANTNPCPEIP